MASSDEVRQASLDGHQSRVLIILEKALAQSLKLSMENQMSTPAFNALMQEIANLEQAAGVTAPIIAKLSETTIDPAQVTVAQTRIKAVADLLMATVAAHTVAMSPSPPTT